jgi:hypothetical protein
MGVARAPFGECCGRTVQQAAYRVGAETGGVGAYEGEALDEGGGESRASAVREARALRQPIESERRRLEEKVTEDLTEAERRILWSALTKIQHAAIALLAESDSHPFRLDPTRPMH